MSQHAEHERRCPVGIELVDGHLEELLPQQWPVGHHETLVVAVRAGGGLGSVLELQVAAVVLVELERGRGGEGQSGRSRVVKAPFK